MLLAKKLFATLKIFSVKAKLFQGKKILKLKTHSVAGVGNPQKMTDANPYFNGLIIKMAGDMMGKYKKYSNKLFFIAVFFMFFLTTNNVASAVDVRFGVFTDTHTYYDPDIYPDEYENAENKLVPILQKFQSVGQSVNLPFIVHLGDLYEDHVGLGTAAANISYTEGYFDQYSCRLLSSDCFDIYLAIGNHGSNVANGGINRAYIGTDLSDYYLSDDPTFTRYDYDWVVNGYRFIIIDSNSTINSSGLISSDTLTWLGDTLADARNANQPAFIFLHYRLDDSDAKIGGVANIILFSPNAHNVRSVINDSGANVLGVFSGHNHIDEARSSEEVKGWPGTSENNWYKVPLETEPSRGDLVTEDGVKLTRGTVGETCSGTGVAGTWDWDAGTFCYSPSSGTPSDHQVDVFGSIDDYAVNYYAMRSSKGSTAVSPTMGDESGAIVEVTGTDKTGVVIHGFAEMTSYHTPYSAYINENGLERWDLDGENDTFSSGSMYDPYPTISYADAKVSTSNKPATFLIQSGRIRESGAIYPKDGSAGAPRIWTCESGAKITNSKDVSNSTWSGPDGNGWYTLTVADVGTVSEDDMMIPKFFGDASLSGPSATPQWDLEGTTLYYNPSSGIPSDHLVEAGTESTILRPIDYRDYITFTGPCVFYGARYWGISFFEETYNNFTLNGVITERNGVAGFYISGATFTNSSFSNITSRNNNYGFSIAGVTNASFSYILAYDNISAGLYTHSSFAGTGATLTVHNATFANNNYGIRLTGTGDTGSTAYTLDNIIVDSRGDYGIRVTAATATGAMTHSYINQNSGSNVWGPLVHSDAVVEGTDPDLADVASNNFTLNYLSGCVDSGNVISGIATDIAGNPIYGTPDIGAYEYQPPFTIASDEMDRGGNVRIYSDGKFRNTSAVFGTTSDLSITPQGGFGSGDYSEWMNIIINTWNTLGDYQKIWIETATIGSATTTHTIGDLEAGKYYNITVDSVLADSSNVSGSNCNDYGACLSDNRGRIMFDYTGSYSSHTFQIDEFDMTQDADADGFTILDGDCDDNNALINPAATEICDGVDNNCDGNIDEGFTDADNDGYAICAGDCDDNNAIINPSTNWYSDSDGDGYGNPSVSLQQCNQPSGFILDNNDCNDDNPLINPLTYWYPDLDSDNYGNPTISLQQCIQPSGYILDNSDCDDNDPNIYPGGPPVRITGGIPDYYSTLQDAFDAAVDGDIINSKDVELAEDIFLNVNISIIIKTGYNCDYTSNTGTTTINGNMTINDGTVTIQSGTLHIQ